MQSKIAVTFGHDTSPTGPAGPSVTASNAPLTPSCPHQARFSTYVQDSGLSWFSVIWAVFPHSLKFVEIFLSFDVVNLSDPLLTLLSSAFLFKSFNIVP